jgi:hypothetical protein
MVDLPVEFRVQVLYALVANDDTAIVSDNSVALYWS